MLIIFVNKFMKKVFIVFIIRNFCQENGRTHLALYFENEGIFISKISQIGSIPCQVYHKGEIIVGNLFKKKVRS